VLGLELSKTLRVVTLGSKELLKVWLAVEHSVHRGIASELQSVVTVGASETGLVEGLSLYFEFLHGVDCLSTDLAFVTSSSTGLRGASS